MTKQEAIDKLTKERELLGDEDLGEWPELLALAEALEMGIAALKEQISREDDGK